jgi:hypothetical protein
MTLYVIGSFFSALAARDRVKNSSSVHVSRSQILKMAHVYRKPPGPPSRRGKCLLGLVWLLSCAAAAPVVSGLVQSWPFPLRYSCQLMSQWAPYYG